MLDEVTVLAPAKVNIGLNVLPKRGDGYHNIESIFQAVKLYDEIRVSLTPEKKGCAIQSGGFLLPEENTFTKTYGAFARLTGFSSGVSVSLKKNIPAGGGLGGGSSDGASFLKALADLSGISLTDGLKNAVASQVGSDVFFFLNCCFDCEGNAAGVVTGRGEFVRTVRPRSDLYFLIVFPDVHSATKEAYELLDESYEAGNKTSCPKLADLEAMYNSPVRQWEFANSFTSVIVQKYTAVACALRDIKSAGADWADMSGSGAAVFGVFESKENAQAAFAKLKKSWQYCVLA